MGERRDDTSIAVCEPITNCENQCAKIFCHQKDLRPALTMKKLFLSTLIQVRIPHRILADGMEHVANIMSWSQGILPQITNPKNLFQADIPPLIHFHV